MTPLQNWLWHTQEERLRFMQSLHAFQYLKAAEFPDSTYPAVELSELPLDVDLRVVFGIPERREVSVIALREEVARAFAHSGSGIMHCTDPWPMKYLESALADFVRDEPERWTDQKWGWSEPTIAPRPTLQASDRLNLDAEMERKLLDSHRVLQQVTGVTEEDYIEY